MALTKDLLWRSWRSWTDNRLIRVGPYWLQLVWTGLFALPIGLLFTLMGFVFHAQGDDWTSWDNWRHWLGLNLFVALFISYFIHAWFEILGRLIGLARLRSWSESRRGLFSALVPITGVLLSWPVAVWLAGFRLNWFGPGLGLNNVNAGMLLFVVMFSALMYFYFEGKARTAAAEREAAEARLRLLQGQIEPHFLFNTLANVLSLLEADPPRARGMLEAFVDYLRSSFGGLREGQHSLGQELLLLQAYLRVLGLRMDERLQWRIDVPEALKALRLPALLLQPLVENAIHHGLEPKIEGGLVEVGARVAAGQLLLTVQDNGLGLAAASHQARPGGRSALVNIRERLQQQFGDEASLTLLERPEGGVTATVQLPLAALTDAPVAP
jgi:Histidine kinase